MDDAPGDTPPLHFAWFGFVILIGQLIWHGLTAAAHVTLAALHWMVLNLSLVVTKIGNGFKALGVELLKGLRRSWDFTRKIWDDVLKPAWTKFWRWFDKFRAWLDRTFAPLLKHLREWRDAFLKFYRDFVRPWLDIIGVTRRLLSVLAALHVPFARELDRRLAKLQEEIDRPFRFVLGKLNEIINVVNRVVTADGLFQRFAYVRSFARDYKYAWNVIKKAYEKPLTDEEKKKLEQKVKARTLKVIQQELDHYLRDGTGKDAAFIDEQAQSLVTYLRSP